MSIISRNFLVELCMEVCKACQFPAKRDPHLAGEGMHQVTRHISSLAAEWQLLL